MVVLSNGKTQFSDIWELNFYLFTEIGLALDNNNSLYDQDTGIVLRYEDKYIKSSVNFGEIVYAGKDDIVFDIVNFKLINTLFGYFIEKFSSDPDNNFEFVASFTDKVGEDKIQANVKYNKFSVISSLPYYNMYLCLIELIFSINGNFEVDLSNFDMPKEI